MKITFDFVLKILLVENKSVKSLRRSKNSVPQRPYITYSKVKGNGERTKEITSLLPSLFSTHFNTCLFIVSYTQNLQPSKRLHPSCYLNNEQLCTICSNPEKSKFLRDYFLRKLVLVCSFPLYS